MPSTAPPSTTRRSAGRQVVIEVIAVIVALAVGASFSAVIIGMEVNEARVNATSAKANADSGNLSGLITSVEGLQGNVEAISAYTKSPAWLITQYIPAIGDPVRAASTLTTGANNVAQASQGFLDLARQLETASTADAQLVPTAVLTNLTPAANQLAIALQEFTADVESLEATAAYGPLQGTVAEALDEAQQLLPELTLLVKTLPSIAVLLGSQSPQKWFIALQNGGEARGTGGLLGSFAVVEMDQGKAKAQTIAANDQLTAKANPNLLPEDSQALWGPARLAEVYGVNLSPNYPYAGELISSMWSKQTGDVPDAVLALDQRATALLIEAVGGVTVDGITVTGANAVQILTVGVYENYPDPVKKDEFVTKVMSQLIQKVSSGQTSPIQLMGKLASAVLDRSVFLWAADAAVQESLAPSPVGGVVPDEPGPISMAVVNNNAGNKMDAFLYTSVALKGGECVAGGRRSTMTVELFNNPPAKLPTDDYFGRGDREQLFGLDGSADGSNRLRVAVYLPRGAFLSSASPQQLFVGAERGHPVAMFGVELKRGERKGVTVDYTEFGDPALLNSAPKVIEQPMLNQQLISIQQGPSC
ncbi:MAG: DUF4012 domain-containing protein [Candidatus Nanopelagicales bacterium]